MDAKPLPARPNLEQFKKQAKAIVKACEGDSDSLRYLREHWPELASLADDEIVQRIRRYVRRSEGKVTLADAQFALARAHGFSSWPKFSHHIHTLNSKGSPFEEAADAVVSGDESVLYDLLDLYPDLVRARSERVHRATLLHYISANGVENYRQKTPPNAARIAQILLDKGADVNAFADMYGGNATTLGLTATSIHPWKAGVAVPLLETLLEAGAELGDSDINGCLANGRPQAAAFLAEKGARIDLEGACGLGRLDLVQALLPQATEDKTKAGFMWACEYGQNDVIEYLLDHGFDVGTLHRGMTGIHWALVGGRLSTIELLIQRGAPLEKENEYGGTALGCALWAVENSDPVYQWPQEPVDWKKILQTLIDAGANLDAYPQMRDELEATLKWLESR